MDLEYTPEQRQLVDAAERFLARACPLSVVRAADGDGRGLEAALWREIAALGWLALELPPDAGAGLSFVETALVAEAISEVATRLGNTRAVCRKCYIHPAIIEAFTGATLTIRIRRSVRSRVTTRLSPQESAVLRFLKRVRKKAS